MEKKKVKKPSRAVLSLFERSAALEGGMCRAKSRRYIRIRTAPGRALPFLDYHRRSIAKNFRCRPFADHFRGVVVEAHHGIGPHFRSVLEEQPVGLLARLFAHLDIRSDPAANDAFEAA